MSRSERVAASASRLGRATERPTGAGDQVVAKVRRTVDLAPHQNRELNRLIDEAAFERGWSRANAQDLLATLVSELLTDATLQRRVIAAMPAPAKRRRASS
ncbi:MAG: hypothetical protein QOF00_5859 [Pseudonocardiales bacterium]|jgi:hypothetical protein|nr:hypothetical protein [Pseudonocardiales bacterium]